MIPDLLPVARPGKAHVDRRITPRQGTYKTEAGVFLDPCIACHERELPTWQSPGALVDYIESHTPNPASQRLRQPSIV